MAVRGNLSLSSLPELSIEIQCFFENIQIEIKKEFIDYFLYSTLLKNSQVQHELKSFTYDLAQLDSSIYLLITTSNEMSKRILNHQDSYNLPVSKNKPEKRDYLNLQNQIADLQAQLAKLQSENTKLNASLNQLYTSNPPKNSNETTIDQKKRGRPKKIEGTTFDIKVLPEITSSEINDVTIEHQHSLDVESTNETNQ